MICQAFWLDGWMWMKARDGLIISAFTDTLATQAKIHSYSTSHSIQYYLRAPDLH